MNKREKPTDKKQHALTLSVIIVVCADVRSVNSSRKTKTLDRQILRLMTVSTRARKTLCLSPTKKKVSMYWIFRLRIFQTSSKGGSYPN